MAGLSRWQFVIKGFDRRIVEDASQYILQYAGELNANVALARLPAKVKRFSILKAPFKYHKHFEAFQFKTYKRLVTIKDLPFEEESHMEHIAKQLPAGINLRVTVERPLSIPLPKLKAKNDAPPAEIQMDQSGIPVPNRVPTLR